MISMGSNKKVSLFIAIIATILAGCSAESVGSGNNYQTGNLRPGDFQTENNQAPDSGNTLISVDSNYSFIPPTPQAQADSSIFEEVELEKDGSCASTSSVAEQIINKTTITTIQPVSIFIMLDISSSMAQLSGNQSKMQIAIDSINQFINGSSSEEIAVALHYFPHFAVPIGDCTGSGFNNPDVPMGRLTDPNHIATISSSLSTTPVALAFTTPIEAALKGATSYCSQFMEQDPFGTGEKCAVIFITDGVPTDCSADSTVISDIAGNAFSDPNNPVMTFGIGMTGADFALLDLISQKGGTDCTPNPDGSVNPDNGYACDVTPNTGMTLLDALELIREVVVNEIEETIDIPVDCEWQLPQPEGDEELNINYINIKFIDGVTGEEKELQRVRTEAECSDVLAWYYDDNVNPTRIIACPNVTCPHIQSVPNSQIEVLVGCRVNII